MKPPIASITPFTFQEYPEHTACIVWFSGCNMRCSYCHNPELVKGTLKKLPMTKIDEFLRSRSGLLEGVVLSGGECTLYKALPSFISYLKDMGYKVKIDTNGSNPSMIKEMMEKKLIDFVALDFKATKKKFLQITQFLDYESFYNTLQMLISSEIEHEVRTTIHADLLSEDDINQMIDCLESLGYKNVYYLQKFRNCKTLSGIEAPTKNFDISAVKKPSFNIELRGF